MKTLLMFAITLSFALATHGIVSAQQSSIALKNIQPKYRSLDEVKPILVNESDKPIYLLPEDCGEAQVLFAGHEVWEPSDYPNCSQSINPVEIKPGESYEIPNLVIRIEVDEGKFNEDKRTWSGKFRIVMRYSLNPIYQSGKPQLKYLKEVVKEFSIVK